MRVILASRWCHVDRCIRIYRRQCVGIADRHRDHDQRENKANDTFFDRFHTNRLLVVSNSIVSIANSLPKYKFYSNSQSITFKTFLHSLFTHDMIHPMKNPIIYESA